jgi:hypothetical protein
MQVQQAGVERLVCQAQMRMAAALLAGGQLRPFPAPFNSEAQRFEQRFGFMQRLQRPEPLAFDQYARSVDISSAPRFTPLSCETIAVLLRLGYVHILARPCILPAASLSLWGFASYTVRRLLLKARAVFQLYAPVI